MKHWHLLILFLLAAVALYFAGLVFESMIILGIGAIFECAFWVKLFRGNTAGQHQDSDA